VDHSVRLAHVFRNFNSKLLHRNYFLFKHCSKFSVQLTREVLVTLRKSGRSIIAVVSVNQFRDVTSSSFLVYQVMVIAS